MTSSMWRMRTVISPQLTYYDFGSGVVAFSTTRHGGVSRGNYGKFNVNPFCGDAPEAVIANLEALASELGISPERIIMPHQVHKTTVKRIDESILSLDGERRAEYLEGVDGLMTDMRGVCIGVSTADCIPILLSDESRHAICALHSGWRGTVADIVGKGVGDMCLEYGCEPSEIKAVIGPGISLQAFEVGDEVYEAFSSAGFDMHRIARRLQKWHIDLPECCCMELLQGGLLPQNITLTGICTYTDVGDYFSARRLGTSSGRIYTAIMNK